MSRALKQGAALHNLDAELAEARIQLEAARTAAEAVANTEAEHLGDDATFATFLRKRKLAELEAERLAKLVDDLDSAIDDERARVELEAFERRYSAVEARNTALRSRLVRYREDDLPKLLDLLRDLAQDEIDVREVNKLVPWARGLNPADSSVRCRPSRPEKVIAETVVERWVDDDGREYPIQEMVDADGTVPGHGKRRVQLYRKKFLHRTSETFSPASDVRPLYETVVLPRFDRIDAPAYDGTHTYGPANAIDVLNAERRGHPRDTVTEIIPLCSSGRIPERSVDLGPQI